MDKSVEQEIAGLLFGGVVVMLLLALALVAFFLIYQKKLVSQQLALQTIQSAYQKELLVAAIEAGERERQRIGSDLHDEIGSTLSAANLLMGQLARSVGGGDQALVASVRESLSDSIQNVRNISHNLHPVVLARFGLAEALHSLYFAGAGPLADLIEVQVDLDVTLPYPQELALYRIVQESVNNALKHAQATRITLALTQQRMQLLLVVSDNGQGFDYRHTQQSNTSGLGLKNLEARVSLLNAVLHLDSAPGRGTQIRVIIPLPAPH